MERSNCNIKLEADCRQDATSDSEKKVVQIYGHSSFDPIPQPEKFFP
jgi:hypothetical protein